MSVILVVICLHQVEMLYRNFICINKFSVNVIPIHLLLSCLFYAKMVCIISSCQKLPKCKVEIKLDKLVLDNIYLCKILPILRITIAKIKYVPKYYQRNSINLVLVAFHVLTNTYFLHCIDFSRLQMMNVSKTYFLWKFLQRINLFINILMCACWPSW